MCVMFFLANATTFADMIRAKGFNKALQQCENNAVICEKTK